MKRTFAVLSISVLAVVACSSSSSVDKPPAPPSVGVVFPATLVGPGVEDTQCVIIRLGNPTPIHVGAIHNTLGLGSHHMVLYQVNDTEEKPTPFPCVPFTDTLDARKGSPLMVTQKPDDTLTLPAGVAFSLEAHQMLRLEMHYINPSSQPRTVTATTDMLPISDADYRDDAAFLFIGNPDIKIAPHSSLTLGPTFFEVPEELADVKFFAMTGHEHKLGTNVQVATTTGPADPGKMVYDVPGWIWSEPKTEVFETPLSIPAGGGFSFTCSWKNETDKAVRFGESVNNEMCFFWAYYYPSRGAKVCFHSDRIGPNTIDLCCPDHPLCTLADQLLAE